MTEAGLAVNKIQISPEEAVLETQPMYLELEQKIRDAGMNLEFSRIRAAYEFAARAHAGQRRKNGDPYVTHCISAAEITVDMGLDEDSIIAALLHDTI